MGLVKELTHQEAISLNESPGYEEDPFDDVATLAECKIHREGHLATYPISCASRDQVLILQGCVPTYYLKQIAQTVAMRIEGVRQVVNQIEVGVSGQRCSGNGRMPQRSFDDYFA